MNLFFSGLLTGNDAAYFSSHTRTPQSGILPSVNEWVVDPINSGLTWNSKVQVKILPGGTELLLP
jgi:hypothetical protein